MPRLDGPGDAHLTEPQTAAPASPEDALVRRLVRLALAGVALAVAAGTTIVVASVLGVSGMAPAPGDGAGTVDVASPSGLLLLSGTLGGMAVAATCAWVVLAPIGNWYRRGMLATVAAFATAVVMLVALPVHVYFGRGGLAVLLGVALLVSLLLGRIVLRLSR